MTSGRKRTFLKESIAKPWYYKDMLLAHMIGEHHYDSFGDKLSHLVASWAGFVMAVIVGAMLCYVVFKNAKASKKDNLNQ